MPLIKIPKMTGSEKDVLRLGKVLAAKVRFRNEDDDQLKVSSSRPASESRKATLGSILLYLRPFVQLIKNRWMKKTRCVLIFGVSSQAQRLLIKVLPVRARLVPPSPDPGMARGCSHWLSLSKDGNRAVAGRVRHMPCL